MMPCGRCGKPRSMRFSKERWALAVRPRLRHLPQGGRDLVHMTFHEEVGSHARYRTVPARVGAGVAMDGRPSGPGRDGAPRGCVGRAWGRTPVALSRVRHRVAALRPRGGTGVAASRYVSVLDVTCMRARRWSGAP